MYKRQIVDRTTFAVTARDIFNAATVNGAKAFGRNDLGKLEKGAKADFVVFKLDNIEMAPVRDVVKNIISVSYTHLDVYKRQEHRQARL